MKYLMIENEGLIDVKAISLIGASTKRGDESKIGQFGSGNKFGLAVLLREIGEVKIFRGLDEIKIESRKVQFRDCEFDQIYVDGKETSLTTSMGKDWCVWQGLRELYCNAIDEGGEKIELVNDISPKDNVTRFYVKTDERVFDFIGNFDHYFSENKEVLFENKHGKILKKGSEKNMLFYRRGIRCYESTIGSLYDYDVKDIDINEDRMVKYYWLTQKSIWRILGECTDKDIIKNVLLNGIKNAEFNCDYVCFDGLDFSKEFLDVASDMVFAPNGAAGLLSTEELCKTVVVPDDLFSLFEAKLDPMCIHPMFKMTSNGKYFTEITMDNLHKNTINKALDFLNECGFPIEYEIKTCIFDDKRVLGCALGGRIYLSTMVLEKGVAETVNTMIEEYIHIKYKVEDETRAFQDAIIGEFVTYMKNKNAYNI